MRGPWPVSPSCASAKDDSRTRTRCCPLSTTARRRPRTRCRELRSCSHAATPTAPRSSSSAPHPSCGSTARVRRPDSSFSSTPSSLPVTSTLRRTRHGGCRRSRMSLSRRTALRLLRVQRADVSRSRRAGAARPASSSKLPWRCGRSSISPSRRRARGPTSPARSVPTTGTRRSSTVGARWRRSRSWGLASRPTEPRSSCAPSVSCPGSEPRASARSRLESRTCSRSSARACQQPRDRRAPARHPQDRCPPRQQRPVEAGAAQPGRGGGLRGAGPHIGQLPDACRHDVG